MEHLLSRLTLEVRQTLHHVMGAFELMADGPMSPKQVRLLSRCRANVDGLLRNTNDIEELSSSPAKPTLSPCRLADVGGEVADIMRVLALRKGLELICSVDASARAQVETDPALVQDILRRLLDNSIRYTEHGTVTLRMKILNAPDDSTAIYMEVLDTGPGLPAQVMEDLCNPRVGVGPGGLGLPIVKRRLECLGGTIQVLSNTPLGVALSIAIPVRVLPELSRRNSSAPDVTGRNSLRMLVAEDSDDSFALVEAFVRDEGHHVVRADNGASAVEMFQGGIYDIVLMDVNMPVMDGYAATRAIREFESRTGRVRVPVILLSAEAAAKQLQFGSAVGCSGYLTKPARKQDLLRALKHYSSEESVLQ